jgi:hypothetical protein
MVCAQNDHLARRGGLGHGVHLGKEGKGLLKQEPLFFGSVLHLRRRHRTPLRTIIG